MRGVEGGQSGRVEGGCCMDSGGVQEMAAYGSESCTHKQGKGVAIQESVRCVGNFTE